MSDDEWSERDDSRPWRVARAWGEEPRGTDTEGDDAPTSVLAALSEDEPVASPGRESDRRADHGRASEAEPPAGQDGRAEEASGDDTEEASVLRSSTVMALGTVVSRASGFVRNIIIVQAIGTAIFADTYNAANTVPNMLYILLVGGALNSVFVPQLVRSMKEDSDGGQAYADRLLTLTAVVLVGISVVTVAAAPLVIDAAAHGLTARGSRAEYSLAVTFARYCLPQILFYGVFVMLGQVLNARGRFGAMMWTPILNNVVVITTFALYLAVAGSGRSAGTITAAEARLLGVGTTLGIVVQALALMPYLRATGFRYRPRFDWRGVGLRKVGQLAKWTMLFVLINQLGYAVVTNVATTVAREAKLQHIPFGVGYTPYTNAYLLFMLPHSIITVSVVTALLPRMSRAVAEQRLEQVREDLSSSLRTIGAVIVPAAFAFVALGPQIAGAMYLLGGRASQADAHEIGYVLMAFALGLVPFSAQYLMLRGFYAFEDTRTTTVMAVVINAVNVVLVLTSYAVLPLRWVVVGMAAGYGVSYTVGLATSARILGRRLGGLDGARVLRTYVRLTAAAGVAAVAAFVVARLCTAVLGGGFAGSVAAVAFGGAVMGAGYVLAARRLRIEELSALLGMVTARLGR